MPKTETTMYAVVDKASRNVMGEFADFADAERMLVELVGASPDAYRDVVIVSDNGEAIPLPAERVRELAWQHPASAV